ncbi:MAG: nucleotidyltransferase family protein [Acidimicrobiales bacterium]
MADSLAAVVLAAGAGTRLRPLSQLRPKALCPVGDRALLDLALARVRGLLRARGGGTGAEAVAVNAHAGLAAMEAHVEALAEPVFLSIEREQALGTAGAVGRLRGWIDGRAVLVANADAWLAPAGGADVDRFVGGWDGEQVRLLCVKDSARGDWGELRYAGLALMPWGLVRRLRAEPAGLYEACWGRLRPGAGLDLVTHEGPFFDCGTPASYLACNLAAAGGRSVIGVGARVEGTLDRCVVWPGAHVHRGERLSWAVRADGGVTVLVR